MHLLAPKLLCFSTNLVFPIHLLPINYILLCAGRSLLYHFSFLFNPHNLSLKMQFSVILVALFASVSLAVPAVTVNKAAAIFNRES
jgi:hypothetical protein